MEKYYKLLFYINKEGFHSQRRLAKAANMSVGSINSILKEMEKAGLLEKIEQEKTVYKLTKKGQNYLEDMLENKKDEKLSFNCKESEDVQKIHTAVILAAGMETEFSKPVGLLTIGDIPIIELMIRNLSQEGIEKFYIVVGYKRQEYQNYFGSRYNIQLIENDRYKWTGTMASLVCVKELAEEDFLLVEGNQILEEVAFTKILNDAAPNCVLLTKPSASGDEAYVELDENYSIFRISKDIRQLNRVDAELVGVSKISRNLFSKMLEYYEGNQNPLLNYEYVIENIGRIYQITGVMVDDMAWTVIENEQLYYKAEKMIYPKIKKRAKLRKENCARSILMNSMGLGEGEIEECRIGGGMTNTNFFVRFHNKQYILRIPGAGTDVMIDRKSEQHNGALAASIGINPSTLYFNAITGVKVTECIEGAETLNGKTARLEVNIKETTRILKMLHQSDMKMYGSFQVQKEYEKYKKKIEELHGVYYPGFEEIDTFFYALMRRLQAIGLATLPCHNDLVAENFIKDKNGRMFLIDWEYSGYNDPMWDLAAHLIECEFEPVEEELFLQYYFGQEADLVSKEKIVIFKMCQDVLWSAWTVLKEAEGEDFGSYGIDRLNRALEMKEEYIKTYEEIF